MKNLNLYNLMKNQISWISWKSQTSLFSWKFKLFSNPHWRAQLLCAWYSTWLRELNPQAGLSRNDLGRKNVFTFIFKSKFKFRFRFIFIFIQLGQGSCIRKLDCRVTTLKTWIFIYIYVMFVSWLIFQLGVTSDIWKLNCQITTMGKLFGLISLTSNRQHFT